MSPPLVVIDTMVVISSIIGRRDGAAAAVMDAVATGEVRLAISDDQLSELVRVLGYPRIAATIKKRSGSPLRAFEAALSIGTMGFMHHPRHLDWPSLKDKKDGWIFDLAFDSAADYIISYDYPVRDASRELGFDVLYSGELLEILRSRYEA